MCSVSAQTSCIRTLHSDKYVDAGIGRFIGLHQLSFLPVVGSGTSRLRSTSKKDFQVLVQSEYNSFGAIQCHSETDYLNIKCHKLLKDWSCSWRRRRGVNLFTTQSLRQVNIVSRLWVKSPVVAAAASLHCNQRAKISL